MADFVTLSCPNCGGKLEITPDIERFACAYCGQEQLVNRGHGIISLKPVLDRLASVKQSVERNVEASEQVANELALQRIVKERTAAEAALETALQSIQEQRSSALKMGCFGILLIGLGLSAVIGSPSKDVGNALVCLFISLLIGVLLLFSSRQQLPKLEQENLARAPLLELQKQEEAIRANLKHTV